MNKGMLEFLKNLITARALLGVIELVKHHEILGSSLDDLSQVLEKTLSFEMDCIAMNQLEEWGIVLEEVSSRFFINHDSSTVHS
jgi:hypothetical protein